MTDRKIVEAKEAVASDTRLPWQSPRITNITEARESEAGILNGPEILIMLS